MVDYLSPPPAAADFDACSSDNLLSHFVDPLESRWPQFESTMKYLFWIVIVTSNHKWCNPIYQWCSWKLSTVIYQPVPCPTIIHNNSLWKSIITVQRSFTIISCGKVSSIFNHHSQSFLVETRATGYQFQSFDGEDGLRCGKWKCWPQVAARD